jgi:osmotically inducible protein OsmC
VHTDAAVTLRFVNDAPTIAKIDLVTEGRVSGIDEDGFVACANEAKDGCLVSRALAGVPDITLVATLAS